MYGRYAGLDIGSDSVKVTLLNRGFKGTTLVGTWRFDLGEGGLEGALGRLAAHVEAGELPASDVAVGIPSQPLTVRVLRFPFDDSKKIEMVYSYELENVTTFDPDEHVHSYHVTPTPGAEGSEAVVCMMRRSDVAEVLSLASVAGIDPRVLTLPSIALSALAPWVEASSPALVVDIGASKTDFALFEGGVLRRVRTTAVGGRTVTERLAAATGMGWEEAERAKREGFVGNRGQDVAKAAAPLVEEIKKTVRFFELEIDSPIGSLSLAGGGSLMPGLKARLHEELEMEVENLHLPDLGHKSPLFATSYALALYGISARRGRLNLRKGEFEFKGRYDELIRRLTAPAALLAVLLLLSFYGSCSRYFELKRSVASMRAEVGQVVAEMFPDVKVIASPVDYLRTQVAKERERLQMFEQIHGGPTPLDVLSEVSRLFPSGVDAKVEEFSLPDDHVAKVSGKASSYEAVAEIQKALEKSAMFAEVKSDRTAKSVDNKIKFQLSLRLAERGGGR